MNSSEIARTVLIAVWIVATLLLTSAQLRVLASTSNRRKRYIIAWLVCLVVLGGLLSAMDSATGSIGVTRRVANFALAATVSAVALAAGEWWTRRPAWANMRGTARFLTIALIHALVVLVIGYPLI